MRRSFCGRHGSRMSAISAAVGTRVDATELGRARPRQCRLPPARRRSARRSGPILAEAVVGWLVCALSNAPEPPLVRPGLTYNQILLHWESTPGRRRNFIKLSHLGVVELSSQNLEKAAKCGTKEGGGR